MDKVLTASPLAVASYYAQEYGLIDQLRVDVEESVVSIAWTPIFLLKLGSLFPDSPPPGPNHPSQA